MNIQDLISKVPIDRLIEKDFRLKRSGNRYFRGIEHDSLVIDLKSNRFYWNSLGISGNAMTWLTEIKGLSYRDALVTLQQHTGLPFTNILDRIDKPTPIYQRLLGTFFELGKRYRSYWYNRGFTDDTIDYFKLGYTGKHYVIPIVVGGMLVNFQCRRGTGNNKRVWNWVDGRSPDLFNCDSLKRDITIIAEGSIDTMTLHQIGFSSVTGNSVSHWNSKWNSYITKLNMVYILYDHDKAGLLGSCRTSRKLLNRGYVLFWPQSFPEKFDVNEALSRLGAEKLKGLITNAMLPNAVHSSDLYEQSKKGALYEYVEIVRKKVNRDMRGLLWE